MTACPQCGNMLACGCISCSTYSSYVPRLVMIPDFAVCPICKFGAEVDLEIEYFDEEDLAQTQDTA